MKKIYLSLLLLFTLQSYSFAQSYFPMALDSATWTYVTCIPSGGPTQTIIDHYALLGDTLIQGKTYSKLYADLGQLNNSSPCFNYSTAQYIAAIREDSSKKIWKRESHDTVDVLHFDYALNLGDTFRFSLLQPYGGYNFQVSLVDSVSIVGNHRKQINFHSPAGHERWIQGIGSRTGWFRHWSFIGNAESKLECYYEKENLLLGNSSFCSCQFIGTNINKLDFLHKNVKIFPNPATSKLNIDFSSIHGIKQIELYSILGKRLSTLNSSHNSISIDISKIEETLFILYLKFENGQTITKKITKINP